MRASFHASNCQTRYFCCFRAVTAIEMVAIFIFNICGFITTSVKNEYQNIKTLAILNFECTGCCRGQILHFPRDLFCTSPHYRTDIKDFHQIFHELVCCKTNRRKTCLQLCSLSSNLIFHSKRHR